MNAKLLAISLGLLLVVSLCLSLILWLQIQQLEDEITQLRNRPQILFPGRRLDRRHATGVGVPE